MAGAIQGFQTFGANQNPFIRAGELFPGGGAPPAFFPQTTGPGQILQIMAQLMQSLSRLAGGWMGFMGQQQPQNPGFIGQQPPQNPGYVGQLPPQYPGYMGQQPPQYPGYGGQQYPGYVGQQPPMNPGFQAPYPGIPNYIPGPGNQPPVVGNQPPVAGGGGTAFPGFPGIPGQIPAFPTDPNDFASYLQAQRLGGSLEGKTTINQRDAIPGTRFATVQNNTAWNAAVARNYAYQFAAYSMNQDPLSAQGLQYGAQNFDKMSPDAKIFTQVASVFKGNMIGGPGFYDNPGLKQLLLSKGLNDFANQGGVGATDVQTIGAVTKALNSGQLSLQEVIQSGTIDNLPRYFKIIDYVRSGGFNNDLRFFDTAGPGQ